MTLKHHIVLKFLAVFLCACSLLVGIASGIGIFLIADQGLYNGSVEDIRSQQMNDDLVRLSRGIAQRYAMENLSNCPSSLIESYIDSYYLTNALTNGYWAYTLESSNGKVLETNLTAELKDATRFEALVTPEYPVVISTHTYGAAATTQAASVPEPTFATATTDATMPVNEPGSYLYNEYFYWADENGEYECELGILQGPTYLVTLYLRKGAYLQTDSPAWAMLELAYTHRFTVIWTLLGSLVLFAATAVYLCCAAGRKPRREVVLPGGLNRLPLDIYLAAAAAGIWACIAIIAELAWWTFDEVYFLPGICIMTLCGFGACLLFVGFWFAVAAQCKLPGFYWWHHSLVGTTLRLLRRLLCSCARFLARVFRACAARLHRFFSLLPMTWQWLLTAGVLGLLLLIALLSRSEGFLLFVLLVCLTTVLYGVHAFGALLEGARRMSQGNLNNKVSTRWLAGSFREFAAHLNALADVAVVAAKNQMKSERMKAELVTNVSHDIKTPLTSIINYVDLLQKAQTPEESAQYLEVLERQSHRLKKLIEDLMEMSKASTGNMAVELGSLDAVEAINQALGEFSDKLDAVGLIPIFKAPAQPVAMQADGRLTWRVLSNLLSNAVKYALPGTRLYIDLVRLDGNVLISLKNISKEQLNVSSEELMERFVRGDASRNTEGSGLGLNIARSLMELQRGQLQLLVDGDLFKVTLLFPEA